MQAAVFEKPGEKLVLRSIPIPVPKVGELLIKVQYCGICGSDLHMTDAAACYPPAAGSVIGHEFCGEIVSLGEGAVQWKEGQRITALPFVGCGSCATCLQGDPVWCRTVRTHVAGDIPGGFAEYVVVGANESLLLPAALSWEEGALIEPMAVAVHALGRSGLAPGARVLIVGAGSVGLAVAACARAFGAGTICVTARTDRRADLARQMGATEFLLNDDQLAANFSQIAGGPPDLIVECVGLPGMLELCSILAAPRSTIVMAGCSMQEECFRPIIATSKELNIQFAARYTRRDFEVAAAMIERGTLDPCVMLTATVGMSAFPQMFETLRGPSEQCKVLLSPST